MDRQKYIPTHLTSSVNGQQNFNHNYPINSNVHNNANNNYNTQNRYPNYIFNESNQREVNSNLKNQSDSRVWQRKNDMLSSKVKRSNYDPYKIPADPFLAEMHLKACTVANEPLSQGQLETCPCCDFSISKEPMSFCCISAEDLGFLGSGFPLFYNFIKYCKLLLLITIGICAGYSIYLNINGDFCTQEKTDEKQKQCHNTLGLIFSLANVKDNPKAINMQSNLSLAVTIVMIPFLWIFRYSQKQTNVTVDEENITPSDYTLLVRNVPLLQRDDYKIQMKKIIEEHPRFHGRINVEKVNLIYDIHSLNILQRNLKKQLKAKQQFLKKNSNVILNESLTPSQMLSFSNIERQVRLVIQRMQQKRREILNDSGMYFSGQLLVTFRYKREKQIILETLAEKPVEGSERVKIKWQEFQLEFIQAPEPNEINWQTIFIDKEVRIDKRRINVVMFVMFMIVCFSVIFYLSYNQMKISHHDEQASIQEKDKYVPNIWLKILQYLISAFIILINKLILPAAIQFFNDEELYSTMSVYNSSLAKKLSVALFMNSALIIFVVQVVIFSNFYGIGGIIIAQSSFFYWNVILGPIIDLVDFPYIYQRILFRWELFKISKNWSVATQKELNELAEPLLYNQGKCYANIINLMWVTYLYSSVIPIASVFSLIYLIIYSWIDQYNLLRRRLVRDSLNEKVSMEMIDLLEGCNFFYAIGSLFFYSIMQNQYQYQQLLQIILAFLYVIAPSIKKSLCGGTVEINSETDMPYKEAKQGFINSYAKQNPVREIFESNNK